MSLGHLVREALGEYLARAGGVELCLAEAIDAVLLAEPFDEPHPDPELSLNVDHYLYGAARRSRRTDERPPCGLRRHRGLGRLALRPRPAPRAGSHTASTAPGRPYRPPDDRVGHGRIRHAPRRRAGLSTTPWPSAKRSRPAASAIWSSPARSESAAPGICSFATGIARSAGWTARASRSWKSSVWVSSSASMTISSAQDS